MVFADGSEGAFYRKSPCQEYYARQMTEDAVESCRIEAHAGNAMAQLLLSRLYRDTNKEIDSIEWLIAAADNGDGEASYELGQRYIAGNSVKKDIIFGLKYLQMAARYVR